MSSSPRKIKLAQPKPRNPLVAPASQRKAGAHRKSKSGQRQEQEARLRKELRGL
ncbi:MAG TPA: hypothetical protein VFM98_06195 [Ramlibacter sp.]|uniref:hypothetical protein n=1 Tax=Ramlibacter sp. TaxID=1917967 RepID=UPI002D804F6B|nr:hypothetical protein [Ramlibacter sp.]HET8745173.1 hypothetical protein [Ramlibacter sp.]